MKKTNIQNWKDLGYGMFVHFGLYSILGGIWKGKKIEYGYSEQILSAAKLPQVDYFNLINEFSIPSFDAEKLVSLAKKAGMKYITMVSKHHDGFCMFDTKTTDFSVTNSPYGKDILKEVSEECKKQGIKMGIYYSWIDWHYPFATPMSDTNSDIITEKHHQFNLAQLTELLTNYGDIVELWMDMGYPSEQQSKDVYDLAHSLQPNIMINSRIWNNYGDFLTMGDNDYPNVDLDFPWQVPATVFKDTWGYRSWQKRDNIEGKINEITNSITSVFDKGGNYLLNIGPDNNGGIVKYEEEVLLGIAKNLEKRPFLRIINKKENYINIKDLEKTEPTLHYNYCGKEYYTNKPVVIGLSWNILVEKDKTYSLSWTKKTPLKEDMKVKVSINDECYYINFRKGDSTNILSEKIISADSKMKISFFSVGENLRIFELKEKDFNINLY